MMRNEAELIRAALEARQRAYAPYSRYLVGAALLCADEEAGSDRVTLCADAEGECGGAGRIAAAVGSGGAASGKITTSPSGTIISGCNIENASYGATICAERTALFAAVARGHRNFTALALVSGPEGADETDLPWPSPCGICRQALREFVNPADFKVILARSEQEYRILTLEQLLPESFGPDYL